MGIKCEGTAKLKIIETDEVFEAIFDPGIFSLLICLSYLKELQLILDNVGGVPVFAE